MKAPATTRRSFLKSSALAGVAVAGPNLLLGQAKGANSRFRVGVMGLKRGKGHIKALLDVPNCEIAYVCDVDDDRLASGDNTIIGKQQEEVKKVSDFRRILDDPEIDALSIAAPNFWHTPAAVLACQAGKHAYVEKPGSYDAYEAKRIVQVADETGMKVQMGTQRRSYSGMLEGIQKIREGVIGKPLYARCWYSNQRPSIGKGKITEPPPGLDWLMWQGPVPEQSYKDNLVHYNWHWHWMYGGGELANNGVHSMDVARWALDVDCPTRVTCNGGRYHYDDDQETPDTAYAVYEFGDVGISWEGSSCHRRKPEETKFVSVYGEGGKVDFSTAAYTVYDLDGNEVEKNTDPPSDVPHFTNFANAVREGEALNQPIECGQLSAMLCHYGNMAYRTNGAVDVDPGTGELVDHPEAMKLWSRPAYREGWEI
ncbi:MAG: Gfo/Idh/MocA family protein [Verrucomicrobiales bacterium]